MLHLHEKQTLFLSFKFSRCRASTRKQNTVECLFLAASTIFCAKSYQNLIYFFFCRTMLKDNFYRPNSVIENERHMITSVMVERRLLPAIFVRYFMFYQNYFDLAWKFFKTARCLLLKISRFLPLIVQI